MSNSSPIKSQVSRLMGALVNARRYVKPLPGQKTEIESLNQLARTVEALAKISESHHDLILEIAANTAASAELVRSTLEANSEQSAKALAASAAHTKSSLKSAEAVRREIHYARDTLNVIRLAATSPILSSVSYVMSAKLMSLEATMSRLVSTDASIARFGDGELKLMLKPEFRLAFQPNSPQLMRDLHRTLNDPIDNLMVCMPQFHSDQHWAGIWSDIWNQVEPLLENQESFGNSHVSRPALFRLMGSTGVDMWREVWAGQDVRLITGKGSRFDMIPELFDSAKSVDRFDSLPIDAYSDMDRILDEGMLGSPDLFVLALGPTGTVLARELALRGVRALDVGHLSASYQNVFEDGKWPEHRPISG